MSVFHFVQPIISAAAKYVFSFAKLLALARHPYVRGTGSYEMRGKPINRNGPLSPQRTRSRGWMMHSAMRLDAKAMLEEFDDRGFVVVASVLDPATVLDPIIAEYEDVLGRLAEDLYRHDEIDSRYEELPFEERLLPLYRDKEDPGMGTNSAGTRYPIGQYFDFCLPPIGIKADTPFWCGPAVFNAIVHELLLDIIEHFIGPEIYSNPIQHVRIKPPEKYLPRNQHGHAIVGPSYWQQDQGVTTEDADQTTMLTVWLPVVDAPVEAGPLKVVPGSHRRGLLTHCPHYTGNGSRFLMRNAQIPERLFNVEDAIPLPVHRGSAIFMHKKTVHGSYSNESDNLRWSFDLRYTPVGAATGREFLPRFVAQSRPSGDRATRSSQVARAVAGGPRKARRLEPSRSGRLSVRSLGLGTP